MKKLALGVLLCGLVVACGDDPKKVTVVMPDGMVQCNPLLNTGCPGNQKCTWLLDAVMPNYVGHIGCAPNGDKAVGATCTYGPPGESGYDDCAAGGVCTNFRNPMTNPTGVCKAVCDQQGGMPQCDMDHVCVIYANLFDLGETTPPAAGVCNVGCNPLADNDFDGSGSDLPNRTGTKCELASEGCYGSPSGGTPPVTGFSCTRDLHYGSTTFYGHRTQCTTATGCADAMTMKPYQNSCNQGYLPFLYESTGSTTVVCIAYCEPKNCFNGSCGTNNMDRLGNAATNNRCNATDRIGDFFGTTGTGSNFTGEDNGEACQYMWYWEIDSATRTYLPSQWSDKVGICFDHSKYTYDSDGDNMRDTPYPPCQALSDGFGSGSDASKPLEYFGAGNLGCVDSTRLMTVNGKRVMPEDAMRKRALMDLPRPLHDARNY